MACAHTLSQYRASRIGLRAYAISAPRVTYGLRTYGSARQIWHENVICTEKEGSCLGLGEEGTWTRASTSSTVDEGEEEREEEGEERGAAGATEGPA
eukprot:2792926-Rhodomonas_salina.1